MTSSDTRPGGAQGPSGTVLDGIRSKIFMDRYSLKNELGKAQETAPEEMWRRVARGIASVEATPELRAHWEERFYEAMEDFKFVPGGRILSGAGTGFEVTYFNCYVIESPDDSRGGILDNLKYLTEIMARGGGVGVNLSTLRPRGSYIKSVNGTSSGPVSWAELYSVITGRVIQQGGTRRGALMIMLDDDHPDIEEFIAAKRIDPLTNKPVTIEHANVSVAVSDAFMQAVKDDADWALQFPTRAQVAAAPALASKVEIRKTIKARQIWELICKSAWTTAEPGLVFMDRYNTRSNTWYYENIRCVNPCGEQGLPPWGVCNLGALNLSTYVSGPVGSGTFDYVALERDSRIAMRFLDNVVDANLYFLEENAKAQLGTRRTGLGTMGLADALIKLGVAYGSPEAVAIIDRIYPHDPRLGLRHVGRHRGGEGGLPRLRLREVPARAVHPRVARADPGQDRQPGHPQRGPADPGPDRHHQPAVGRVVRHRAGLLLRDEAGGPHRRAHDVPPAARSLEAGASGRADARLLRRLQRAVAGRAHRGPGAHAALHRLVDLQDGQRPE